MTKQWQAEISVDISLARQLIQQQFPELRLNDIYLLGSGWDNTVYRVNHNLVFRFPRRQIAVPLLARELYVLPKLASALPLAIPYPRYHGEPSDDYAWRFAGYDFLPGKTACRVNLNPKQRHAMAPLLGRCLAQLHAVDRKQLSQLSTDSIGRMDVNKRLPQTIANLRQLDKLNLFHSDSLYNWLDDFSAIAHQADYCLTHGDLYARHLLINDQQQLTAIIDWGDCEIGHPAIDLAIAWSFLPPSAHHVFHQAYGEIHQQTWQLAKLRAVFSASTILLYGHDIQDHDLSREGLLGLDWCANTT